MQHQYQNTTTSTKPVVTSDVGLKMMMKPTKAQSLPMSLLNIDEKNSRDRMEQDDVANTTWFVL